MVGELERPLVSNDVDLAQDQSNDLTRNYDLDGECHLNAALLRPPRTQGLVHKQRLSSASRRLALGDSVVGDVSDPLDGILVGQTLKRRVVTEHLVELQTHGRPENQSQNLRFGTENDRPQESVPNTDAISDQRSCLSLQVVSGPSCGLHCSVLSTSTARLPLTLGRVPPSYLLLKDYEVSGKHAMITWNLNKLRWELVDMGSLNGTLLNSRPIHHPDPGSRLWGDPVELASGDTITVGTTSNIYVHISSHNERLVPFGVGITSDPMSLRRGGKKLPMEDVCYYHWPLPGINQFGVFGICDGHGGVGAAKSASKILPEMVATILTDSVKRERVVSEQDASDVLRDAFSQTEASMNNYYEGCTATLLLVWADADENFFAQCANVGDSACFINMDGKQIKMTEDHKVTSCSERLRIEGIGEPLKDGETRLCGLNLARMLGDKFVKQQDSRFSSEPYISQVVHLKKSSGAFALLASDGLWDVVSFKKAIQLVVQARERHSTETENLAEKIAEVMLNEARTQRTKDNTSIIFIDFDSSSTVSSCKVRP
ncbi:protein phosphatase 2C 70-like isoform X2 [Gossypium arboreum]|uniref:protein phosphatase 2C 70-like isoform X2 n=1 Tax=Gossypium arboreum TaxID=29729 RepID=UPI000818F27D|nr:protein phosphatase 2C 70-like isoform X2 [Gossypium arboreum]XP_017633917.1 protein phosphatase 2C 70-like isoform X2 [Gossypium arboreum]